MGKKQKVLLVDDNRINRRVMGALLKIMNLEVTEASDGFEALELLKKYEFDIVFMDVFMPEIDGYETSKRIRKLGGANKTIPIIVVTANDKEETEKKIGEYGINGVLTKPLRKEALEEVLKEISVETLEVFDQEGFVSLYDDESLREEILNTFLDDNLKDRKNITEAFISKDCELIHKALHYMKGSFSYLNAPKILQKTQQILDLSSENKINEVLLLEKTLLYNYDLLVKELREYLSEL